MSVFVNTMRHIPESRPFEGFTATPFSITNEDLVKKVVAVKQINKALKSVGFEVVITNEDGTLCGPDEFMIRRKPT